MLSLSRKRHERILIGEKIVLTVIRIRGKQVRLAFHAPRELAIVREELAGRWPQPPGRLAATAPDADPEEARSLLVVSRREHQRVLVGDEVAVMVVRVEGKQVRLGIEAPPAIRIFRQELVAGPSAEAPVMGEPSCLGQAV